uniref:Uncharacterized protein n=1 Tax=Arion vulgaris TaxID=1028688 RepID=A0A0B7B9K1_9EUPU
MESHLMGKLSNVVADCAAFDRSLCLKHIEQMTLCCKCGLTVMVVSHLELQLLVILLQQLVMCMVDYITSTRYTFIVKMIICCLGYVDVCENERTDRLASVAGKMMGETLKLILNLSSDFRSQELHVV